MRLCRYLVKMVRSGAVVLLLILLQTGFTIEVASAQSQGEILFMSDQDGNREIYVMDS